MTMGDPLTNSQPEKCPSSTGIRESERFGTPPGRASSITRAGKEEGGSNSKYRGGRVSSLSVLRARQALLDGPTAPLSPVNLEQPQVTGACRSATMYIDPCLRQRTVTASKAESMAGWLESVESPHPGLLKQRTPQVQSTPHSWLPGGVREP